MTVLTCKQTLSRVFEYNTPMVLHTNSKTIGITFRLLQLLIGLLVLIYYIIYKGGYQTESHTILSSSILERKDENKKIALENVVDSFEKELSSPFSIDVKGVGEIYFPVFAIITVQNISTCAEDPRVKLAECDPLRKQCLPGKRLFDGNGNMTGKCVLHPGWDIHTCEIDGWCPVQSYPLSIKETIGYFSAAVIVENSVHFPAFPERGSLTNYDGSTILCWIHGHYYSAAHPLCPVFSFEWIEEKAAKNQKSTSLPLSDIHKTGGVILLRIKWDCNFDIGDPSKQCSIDYEVHRMDSITNISMTTPYYTHFGLVQEQRVISEIYAVRLMVVTEGRARKFDFVTLLTRVGASMGLFAFVTLLCEIMLACACCYTERKIRQIKYVEIEQKPQ